MLYLIIFISLIIGILTIYLGVSSYRQYSEITHTTDPVSLGQVILLSVKFGVAFWLFTFLLFLILGIFSEDKTRWSFAEMIGVLGLSSIVGLIVTLGSFYQIITTIKYRDHLVKKYKVKK
jgi:hypothetical protein